MTELLKLMPVVIGWVPITPLTRQQWAQRMVEDWRARPERPLLMTSANGHVLSLYAKDAKFRALMNQADGVDADGMPLVLASRYLTRQPIPERVATTDFFHDAAKVASNHGLRFFLLGANPEENAAALAKVKELYPCLQASGHHGYFTKDQEGDVIWRILDFQTDILWIGRGVPLEQDFAVRNRERLKGVTWIKTCGGLLNFLSGSKARAPAILQKAGLEWAWRMMLEPRRLFWRYAVTNVHAAWLMLQSASLSTADRREAVAGRMGRG